MKRPKTRARATHTMSTFHGLKEGDEVEVEINEKARDGRGLARANGLIIFVERASVGERVRVRITKLAARHAQGEVVGRSKQGSDQGQ